MRKNILLIFIAIVVIMAGLLFARQHKTAESSAEGTEIIYETEKPSSALDDVPEVSDNQSDENNQVIGETEIETETEAESIEDQIAAVCETVRSMDFTANESHMDVTPEENREYLEAYLKVLKNEMPVYGGSYTGVQEEYYYEDLWRAGIEFEKLLEEKDERESYYLYYYDDLDGDGKPEFAINQGCLFIFNYELGETSCGIIYGQQTCYFKKIVGAGQIWYHDGLHANVIRDALINFTEDGEEEWVLDLNEYLSETNPYYMIRIGWGSEQVDVGKDNWDEITAPFFEMVENHGFEEKTLEEVFGELL